MSTGLLTTSVGSFPKPDYLIEARARAARGEIAAEELDRLARQATAEWIAFQDEIGIDIVVDGEQYRGDMAAYFGEHLTGMTLSGLVRSYGNRYYKKPIISGDIAREAPITVDWWKYAQSLTKRPVKGMLTGPYTIADWSFIERYATRREAVLALARVINEEARDLEAAGARYIQIDEPAVSVRPEELPLVIEAMGVATQGLTAHTITHMCYGDFTTVYPGILDMPVDQIDLELTNSSFDTFALFKSHPFRKELAMGVVDVHSHRVPGEDEVVAAIKRGLEVVPPERLFIDPDCGLKTRTVQEAKDMMRVIRSATDRIKRELGVGEAKA